jgi:NADPH2:quinone reductase
VLVSAGGVGRSGGYSASQTCRSTCAYTVGSADKAARTKEAGADVAINYREQDFAAEVQKLTDGKGVDVIIENVASDNLAKDLVIAAKDSRIIVIGTGTAKGPDGHFAVMHSLMKEVNIFRNELVNAVTVHRRNG